MFTSHSLFFLFQFMAGFGSNLLLMSCKNSTVTPPELSTLQEVWANKAQQTHGITCCPIVDGSHNCHYPRCGSFVGAAHTAPTAGLWCAKCSCTSCCSGFSLLIKLEIHPFTISNVCYCGAASTAAKGHWHYTIDITKSDGYTNTNC